MTYYEAYSKCKTREQMEEAMKHDVEVAMYFGSNPDRLKAIAKDLAWIKDNDISERDFDVQRDCFYLLRDYLEREMGINYGATDEDYYEGSEDG